jgi:hypothetical protein
MDRSPVENIIAAELMKKSLAIHCFQKLMFTTALDWAV